LSGAYPIRLGCEVVKEQVVNKPFNPLLRKQILFCNRASENLSWSAENEKALHLSIAEKFCGLQPSLIIFLLPGAESEEQSHLFIAK